MANKDKATTGAAGAQNTGNPNGTTTSTAPDDIISMFQTDPNVDMGNGDPIPGEEGAAPGSPEYTGGNGTPGDRQSDAAPFGTVPTAAGDAAAATEAQNIDLAEENRKLREQLAAATGRTNETVQPNNLAGHGLPEEKTADEIQKYERWQMKAKTKQMNIIGVGLKDVLQGYEPVSKIGETEIPGRIALVLNEQTPNNLHHYFLPGKQEFVDAERYF